MSAVEIRVEKDRVVIEPQTNVDPAAITTVRLGLAGALAVVDLLADAAVPSASIFDVAAAGWWLGLVYGREVSAAVANTAEDGVARRAEAADGPLLDPVRRLALALHLLRYWPSTDEQRWLPLEAWLLRAEAGSVALEADEALAPADGLAAALLGEDLLALASSLALHHRRVGASAADDAIDAAVLQAARDAVDIVDSDSDGYELLAEMLGRVDDDERRIQETLRRVDDELAAGLSTESEDAPARAVRATVMLGPGDGERIASGAQTVDPRAVQARLLSTADSAIRWAVCQEEGGLRCDVSVDAVADEQPRFGPLFARVEHGGSVAVVALTRGEDDDGLYYTGSVWLDASVPIDGLVVTAYGGLPSPELRPMRSEDERRRDRDAIASFVGDRLARTAGRNAPGWRRPFAAEFAFDARVDPR